MQLLNVKVIIKYLHKVLKSAYYIILHHRLELSAASEEDFLEISEG